MRNVVLSILAILAVSPAFAQQVEAIFGVTPTNRAEMLMGGMPGSWLPDRDFLLPESATRRYQDTEVVDAVPQGMSPWQTALFLRIARNEIYARHGRRFKDQQLQAYFSSRPWYRPRDGEPKLGAIEAHNVKVILAVDRGTGGAE